MGFDPITLLNRHVCLFDSTVNIDKNVSVIDVSEEIDLAEEYEKAQKRLKEVRGLLADRIIKHLIGHSVGPGACTEVGVSQILGMPRTTVRNVMQDLISEEILYQEPTRSRPTFKPYSVKSVISALDKGYVSFTKKEFDEIFSVMEKVEEDEYGLWGMPFVGQKIKGKQINRFLTASLRNSLKELMTRFREFQPRESFSDLLVQSYGEETHKEIVLMFPEHEILNDMVEQDQGLLARWITFNEDRDHPTTPEEARHLFCQSIEEKIRSALSIAQEFIRTVESIDFQTFAKKFQEDHERSFPKECLWGYTKALKHATNLGKQVEVSQQLIQELETTISKLDTITKSEPKATRAKSKKKITTKK